MSWVSPSTFIYLIRLLVFSRLVLESWEIFFFKAITWINFLSWFFVNSNHIVDLIFYFLHNRIALLSWEHLVISVLIKEKSWLNDFVNPKFAWNHNCSRILLVIILIHRSSLDKSWYDLNSSFEHSVLKSLEINRSSSQIIIDSLSSTKHNWSIGTCLRDKLIGQCAWFSH